MAIEFLQLGPDDTAMLSGHLTLWHGGRGLGAERVERETRRLLRDDHDWHVWLIRAGGGAVGYLVLGFRGVGRSVPPRATLAALYLEPAARGRGIGSRAHRFVHEIGRWLRVGILAGDPASEDRPLGWVIPRDAARGWQDSGEWRAIA